MTKVLISGGSGLLGTKITEILLNEGKEVAHLSTRKNYRRKGVEVFYWNPGAQEIDEKAFDGVSSLIHLAGAGIADKAWTNARKKEIINSRVESSKLLMNYLNTNTHQVTKFLGASAIGYYGNKEGVIVEEAEPGDDFLAHVCQLWEESYELENPNVNKAVFRIGIVLAKEGGALPEMTKTLPFFVGILGKGEQIYSWIHLEDLARMFIHAINNQEVRGVFNAVAPEPVAQKDLANEIAHLKSSITLPAPKFALKLALGEMSTVLFADQQCSSEKIQSRGFKFNFSSAKSALADLF